jgi:hypothetical protein
MMVRRSARHRQTRPADPTGRPKEIEMEVRAAVAFEAGKPLEVATVKLDGPKAG